MDDIDWYRNGVGSQTQTTDPSVTSRFFDVEDVPDDLVEDIIRHVVVRCICPDCGDTSFYYSPRLGHRVPADCQGGCGTQLHVD
ncbi:hypothetical protein ACFPYI_13700 [Halomarina salina]|uniref:Uncharacterized protein n=1 Tax=Halomarina salina TaxID=1872699 RepID=A0ABD5RQ42_9EURY|nr:hypothetical protein [Halomarina salina]